MTRVAHIKQLFIVAEHGQGIVQLIVATEAFVFRFFFSVNLTVAAMLKIRIDRVYAATSCGF